MEADLAGRADVLRIDITERVGRDVARRYGMSATPSFIVFSAEGNEVHRDSGAPDIERLKSEALSSG